MRKDICIIVIVALLLQGCQTTETQVDLREKIIGTWYEEGHYEPDFTFYEDGKMDMASGDSYSGDITIHTNLKWDIVEDNVIKISASGGTAYFPIVSIDRECLTLRLGEYDVQFWNDIHGVPEWAIQEYKEKEKNIEIIENEFFLDELEEQDEEYKSENEEAKRNKREVEEVGSVSGENDKQLLYEALKEATGASNNEVLVFEYNDYDQNGNMEAFAFVGESDINEYESTASGEIWFINHEECINLTERNDYWLINEDRIADVITFPQRKYINFNEYFTTGSLSLIWTVRDDKPVKSNIYEKGEVSEYDNNGNVSLIVSDYDALCDLEFGEWTGHTYKPYYFYYDSELDDFREYGAAHIAKADANSIFGFDIISEIEIEGNVVDDILMRANNILEINYHFDDEDCRTFSNVVYSVKTKQYLGYAGSGSIHSWRESGFEGIFEDAICPEIAAYPE